MEDLDAIKGSPWAPSGVLRDVLPDVPPRPILSRDEPPSVNVQERPVQKKMNISQDILNKFGYTPGCAKCRTVSRNEYSLPFRLGTFSGLSHQDRCSTQADPVYRDRAERAEQRKMDFHAREVDRIDYPRRASLEPSVVPGPPIEEKEPEQDLSGEIPVPSADETLTPAEIPVLPSDAIPSSSTWCEKCEQ